jgi:hypothetical protein
MPLRCISYNKKVEMRERLNEVESGERQDGGIGKPRGDLVAAGVVATD